MNDRLKVILACNFKRDETLGSSRVPLRLAAELDRLGARTETVFSEQLIPIGQPRMDQAFAPFRMAFALRAAAAEADIVDIAGGDAWAYEILKSVRRPRQRVVSRSNGLWFRALEVETRSTDRIRGFASSVYQAQVLRRWERMSIARADLSVFGATHDADDVVRLGWTVPERVAVVSPGVDAFFESPVPLAERRHVAFVGTMHHRKGSDVLGAAMSRVLRARPELILTLFGAGMPEHAAHASFDPEVRQQVRVLQSVPSNELARQLSSFAVLVFPSRYEGFGLVVLEAMRAGLAVVVTPTGAGSEVVRDGDTGIVVPINDVLSTARAVERLLDDSALRIRIAERGREESRNRSWARTAQELLRAYESALSRPAVVTLR